MQTHTTYPKHFASWPVFRASTVSLFAFAFVASSAFHLSGFVVAFGLFFAQPAWFDGLRALGAGFLLYLGCRALMAQRDASANAREANSGGGKAAREGLVIALSNPKVALFFAALFSQFIQPDATLKTQLMIAITAAVIDALWYMVVAILSSRPVWSGYLTQHGRLLGRGFGVILIVLSAAVLSSIWQPL